MSPEKQRIAIAKACGWTEIDGLSAKGLMGKPPNRLCSFEYLPDYLNDLNACHEMEKVLTSEQLTVYRNTLGIMNGGICIDDGGSFVNLGFAVSATAAQRAEAFLLALGLWQVTPTQPQ
jgi:hypothetical protein